MDEDQLFAYQPPPYVENIEHSTTKFSHLTQPTQAHLQPEFDYYSSQRPMTAPSYLSSSDETMQSLYSHSKPSTSLNFLPLPAPPALQQFLMHDGESQQRPATSTGHPMASQYYTSPSALHPAHFQMPGMTSQPLAQQRRVSSVYPFSHDPFPTASSSSRPTTANARLVSSRPGTAGTIRPETGTSVASTIIEGATTALGPDGRLYQFVGLQATQKKRARRRFDEIERMYTCSYSGCTKAYGVGFPLLLREEHSKG